MKSLVKQEHETIVKLLKDDGTFPNNKNLPLIVYKNALDLPQENAAAALEDLFTKHQWGNSWRNGIYPYHHYHSTAHEVLGIYRGQAKVELGGPEGITVTVHKRDVIIIAAGVVHKNLGASSDFACVGAYPQGQSFDMNYGEPGERPNADRNIEQVPLPDTDPVYGDKGAIVEQWIK